MPDEVAPLRRRRWVSAVLILTLAVSVFGNLALWLSNRSDQQAYRSDRAAQQQEAERARKTCRSMARDRAEKDAQGSVRITFSEVVVMSVDDEGQPLAWVRGRASADKDIGFEGYECQVSRGGSTFVPGGGLEGVWTVCLLPECEANVIGQRTG